MAGITTAGAGRDTVVVMKKQSSAGCRAYLDSLLGLLSVCRRPVSPATECPEVLPMEATPTPPAPPDTRHGDECLVNPHPRGARHTPRIRCPLQQVSREVCRHSWTLKATQHLQGLVL